MQFQPFDGDAALLGIDGPTTARWYRDHFLASWNARNEAWMLDCVTEDIALEDSSWGDASLVGKAAFLKVARSQFTAFPDLRYEMVDGPFVKPGEAAAMFIARTAGTMLGPLGRLAATGRAIHYLSVEVLYFRDGKVARDFHRFDTRDYFRQMGVRP